MFYKVLNLLPKIIFWGVIATLLVPFFYSAKPIFGFLFRQEFLFQMAVEILAFLYIVLILFDPSYRPKLSWVLISFAALVFVYSLSDVFSVYPTRSFFSSWERLTGLLSYLHYFAFFIIVSGTAKRRADLNRLLMIVTASGGLMTLMALAARWKLFGAGALYMDNAARLSGTFANPDFFGSYLLFVVFLALYIFVKILKGGEEGLAYKWVWPVIAVLGAVGVFLTQTRGAAFALWAGLIVFFIALRLKEKLVPAKVQVAGLIVLILAPLALLSAAKVMPNNPYVERFASKSVLESGLRNRVLAWSISGKMLAEKPALGWGPEGFSAAFDKYFKVDFLTVVGTQESWFDRSHNIFLDALISAGILGAAAWLFFMGAIFFASWEWSPLILVVPVAYLIQGMVVFDTFASLLMFSFFAAYVSQGFLVRQKSTSPETAEKDLKNSPADLFFKYSIIFSSGVIVLVALIVCNIKPAAAFGYAVASANAFEAGDQNYKSLVTKAFNVSQPYRSDLWLLYSDGLMSLTDSGEIRNSDVPRLHDSLAMSVDIFNSLDKKEIGARYYYLAGRVGNMLGNLNDPRPQFVKENLEKSLALSPNRTDTYYELAVMAKLKGDDAGMLDYLNKALALSPKIPQTHFNLGIAYAGLGRNQDALNELKIARDLGYAPRNFGEAASVVQVWISAKEPIDNELADWYVAAVQNQFSPQDPRLYEQLASFYKLIGNKEQATYWAKKLEELNPSYKSAVDKFIQGLK